MYFFSGMFSFILGYFGKGTIAVALKWVLHGEVGVHEGFTPSRKL